VSRCWEILVKQPRAHHRGEARGDRCPIQPKDCPIPRLTSVFRPKSVLREETRTIIRGLSADAIHLEIIYDTLKLSNTVPQKTFSTHFHLFNFIKSFVVVLSTQDYLRVVWLIKMINTIFSFLKRKAKRVAINLAQTRVTWFCWSSSNLRILVLDAL